MRNIAPLGFSTLAARLVDRANDAVRRGEISERGLARLAGYSQPHTHNVLHGVRGLSAAMADDLMRALRISLTALLTPEEGGPSSSGGQPGAPAPVLAGTLGGGRAFPVEPRRPEVESFPWGSLQGLVRPAVCRVDRDETAMWPELRPGDTVLLDRCPRKRRGPRLEDIYAIRWKGRGYLRRCRVVGGRLLLVSDQEWPGAGPPGRAELNRDEILGVIHGRVNWIGRRLDGK